MNMNAPTPLPVNEFRALWSRGYKRLIPIIPPEADVAPNTTVAKLVGTPKDVRGKVPGVKGRDGKWHPLRGWLQYEATEEDLDRWHLMGASIGVLTGYETVVVDADAYGAKEAGAIHDIVRDELGASPTRVGQAPKAAYVFAPAEPIPYQSVSFGEIENGRQKNRVEFLSTGKQLVVRGPHAKTKLPYQWPERLVPVAELTRVTAAQVERLMARLKAVLPNATKVETAGGDGDVNQETLTEKVAGSVRAALEHIPNTSAHFPTRESYLLMGYAIKGALGEDGFEPFADWCARWADGINDPDTVSSDWARMKGPFRIGAPWVIETAAELSGGAFSAANVWCEEVPEPEPAPPEPESLFPNDEPVSVDPRLLILPVSDLAGLEIPTQKWLVDQFIPERNVTLLYGDGGTGKSLLALQLCFSVTTGSLWLGLKTGRGPALFITAEDEIEELQRRLASICAPEGYIFSDLPNLHVASLNGRDAVLAAPNMKTGLMEPTALYAAVKKRVLALRPAVLVLDTLADLFGGDEIKRIQARQFIQLLQGLVAASDWGLAVVLLAHPSLSGMNSGSGTSGNTAWSNSVRSRLYLSRRTSRRGDGEIVEPDVDARVLTNKKTNRGKVGGEIALRWAAGRFVLVGAGEASETPRRDVEDEVAFLAMLDEYAKGAREVSEAVSARNHAPKLFSEHAIGIDIGKARLAAAMDRLFKQDILAVEEYGPPSRRFKRIIRRPIIGIE